MTLHPAAASLRFRALISKLRLPRPTLQVETRALVCVSFLVLAGNGPFWRAALAFRSWKAATSWGFVAQAKVEHGQVVHIVGERPSGGVAVHDPINAETGIAQALPQRAANHGVVFNQQ